MCQFFLASSGNYGSYYGNLASFYDQGQFKEIATPPQVMHGGCAAFIPDDHNFVYLCGGEIYATPKVVNTNRFYVYDISKNIYTELAKVPTPGNYGFALQACVGAVTSTGDKVSLLLCSAIARPLEIRFENI